MSVKIIHLQRPATSGTDQDQKKKTKNPLNPLGQQTRSLLRDSLLQAIRDPSVSSIVLFGGSNFSAGADIHEFSSSKDGSSPGPQTMLSSSPSVPSLTDLGNLISSSPKPVVAALTGVVLGGGCELALACHFRVASGRAKMGLPEVKIGLVPGAGGTQRLPRVCKNVAWSLDVIVSGRMFDMEEAKGKGVIDEVVPVSTNQVPSQELQQEEDPHLQEVLNVAVKWAKFAELMKDMTYRTASNLRVFALDDIQGRKQAHLICDQVKRKLPPKERGGEAQHAAVEAVRASFDHASFEDGMEMESRIFWDLLLNSAQGRGMRHAFFAERAAQSKNTRLLVGPIAELFMDAKSSSPLVGVIGAGTMGAGIAVCFLRAGCHVILVDNDAKGLDRGVQSIVQIFKQDVAKHRITSQQAETILSKNFTHTTDMTKGNFGNCVMVIEAVFENLKVKQSIFSTLDKIIIHPHALLLTNTSTLSIDLIASALSPQRRPYCAGMHFFSPAHLMKLVEIVVSSTSSPETIALVQYITSKRLRKIGVTVGNCPGFVGNRMIHPYSSEAVFILEEGGATVPEVDRALYNFGIAMGPLSMGDLAGNDIGYLIAKSKGLTKDPKTGKPGPNRKPGMRYSDLADDLVVKLGRVGMKAQKGWYDYDPKIGKGRKPIPSKEVEAFIRGYIKEGPAIEKYTQQEIVERCLFGLVNEGFKILEENIAKKPSDIDVIYIYGYGWPAYRGGPMFWIDHEVGLAYFLKRLEEMHRSFPGSSYYEPSKLLKECVALGISLEDYYKNRHRPSNQSRL